MIYKKYYRLLNPSGEVTAGSIALMRVSPSSLIKAIL